MVRLEPRARFLRGSGRISRRRSSHAAAANIDVVDDHLAVLFWPLVVAPGPRAEQPEAEEGGEEDQEVAHGVTARTGSPSTVSAGRRASLRHLIRTVASFCG